MIEIIPNGHSIFVHFTVGLLLAVITPIKKGQSTTGLLTLVSAKKYSPSL